MSAPAPPKKWIVLPIVIPSTAFLVSSYDTEIEAQRAAIGLAIQTKLQHYVMESTYYADPEIPTQAITALITPIP